MSSESERQAESQGESTAFAGKRRAARKRRTLAIECRGPGGIRLEARTVDVSRGGTLIEITDPDAFSTDRSAPFAGRAQEIGALFADGIDIAFGDGAVLASARIIRHVVDVDRPEMVLLGCRFTPELSPVDCRLLGIELESDEAPGAPSRDDGAVPTVRREGDELVAFITRSGHAWSAPAGPTDSSPIRLVDLTPPRTSPAVPPHATAKLGKVSPIRLRYDGRKRAAEGPAADAVAAPSAPPTPTPSPAGEGLTDDDFRRMGRERRGVRVSAVPGKAADWAGPGCVAVYLFPSMADALAPRYHGRLDRFDSSTIVVDLPVPPTDVDAVGHGAGLGENVRAVFVRDGHVLGEASCRVDRLVETEVGVLRALLAPTQKPSDGLRRAISANH